MKPRTYISIDPDTQESGVAVYDTTTKQLTHVATLRFWALIEMLSEHVPVHPIEPTTTVIIENSWQIAKSNWHGGSGGVAQKIAKNVGANHMVGRLLVEFCEVHGIPVLQPAPIGKKGVKFTRQQTGWKGKLNQETCDAIWMVWGR